MKVRSDLWQSSFKVEKMGEEKLKDCIIECDEGKRRYKMRIMSALWTPGGLIRPLTEFGNPGS